MPFCSVRSFSWFRNVSGQAVAVAFRIVPRLTARGVPSLGEEALRSVHDAEAGEAVRGIRTPCVPSDGWPKRSRGTEAFRAESVKVPPTYGHTILSLWLWGSIGSFFTNSSPD